MSRRIDIELTSPRDDGSWTWRAAGAREPRGTVPGALVPSGSQVGDVLRAEIDGYLDQMSVVAVLPPKAPRREPERLELRGGTDRPLVTTTLVRERPGERRPRDRGERRERDGRGDRREDAGRRERADRDRGRSDREGRRPGGPGRDRPARDRQEARHERPARPSPPPVESRPKPKRLRPGKAHRTALLEALANRVEKEHAAWLAELADALEAGRVVRALRLSSRPPKAGAPIPGDLGNRLVEAASEALAAEASQDRWATVLDALAFSPVRRRVLPQSLPTKLSPELRATVARVGSRLPEIAHIFAIEPDES